MPEGSVREHVGELFEGLLYTPSLGAVTSVSARRRNIPIASALQPGEWEVNHLSSGPHGSTWAMAVATA